MLQYIICVERHDGTEIIHEMKGKLRDAIMVARELAKEDPSDYPIFWDIRREAWVKHYNDTVLDWKIVREFVQHGERLTAIDGEDIDYV